MTFFLFSVLETFLKFFLLALLLFTPWNPLDSTLRPFVFSFSFFPVNFFLSMFIFSLFLFTLNSFLFDSFQDFCLLPPVPLCFTVPGFGFLTALETLIFLPSTSCWFSLTASWTLSSVAKLTYP